MPEKINDFQLMAVEPSNFSPGLDRRQGEAIKVLMDCLIGATLAPAMPRRHQPQFFIIMSGNPEDAVGHPLFDILISPLMTRYGLLDSLTPPFVRND